MDNKFWQEASSGLEVPLYPDFPTHDYHPRIEWTVDHEINNIECGNALPTNLQAAWAILLAQYANNNDVVFGTMAERVQGSSMVFGDALSHAAPLPLRVSVDLPSDLKGWLEGIRFSAEAVKVFRLSCGWNEIESGRQPLDRRRQQHSPAGTGGGGG
ncbi:hypothetical protein BJX63DRAFT_433994 [Aspergillus granulosus]|uniref:Condensation domain-containing protein n=1 Tax=Aspergillus granulosus TaxID=176169 RepID=A0ABR4H5P4_9EURO